MGYRNAMRAVLNPLIGLGAKYGVTMLIMAHTNKRDNAAGRNRVADSSDIWDIARSVFIIGNTGNDNIRYLSHEKCNYGLLQETALFTIDDGMPVFKDYTDMRDEDFQAAKTKSRKSSALDDAKTFTLNQVRHGRVSTTELNDLAEAVGISGSALKRARKELKDEGKIAVIREGSNRGENQQITFLAPITE